MLKYWFKIDYMCIISWSLLFVLGCHLVLADDDDDTSECLPQIADRCFKEVFDKLPCSLKREIPVDSCPSKSTSINNEFKDFCSALDDSLSCSSDIIDSACDLKDGRAMFDVWLNGLQAVNTFICMNVNETLKLMTDNAKCWNSILFFECFKATTRIQHVVDIMNSQLDLNECILIVFGLAECNLYAGEVPQDDYCSPQVPRELIKELIHIFLSKTNCNNYKLSSAANKSSYSIFIYASIFVLFSILRLLNKKCIYM